jgi:hypothetical protein
VNPFKLADLLPYGSGFDCDWWIDVMKNGNLVVSTDFHRMNGDGFYVGYANIVFRIMFDRSRKELRGTFIAGRFKTDPCLYGVDDEIVESLRDLQLNWFLPAARR